MRPRPVARSIERVAFKGLEADVVAFQEMESFAGGEGGEVNLTLEWLLERNPGYAAAAVGDWREFPSTQPILYRTARLRLLEQGWYFFSETPDVNPPAESVPANARVREPCGSDPIRSPGSANPAPRDREAAPDRREVAGNSIIRSIAS